MTLFSNDAGVMGMCAVLPGICTWGGLNFNNVKNKKQLKKLNQNIKSPSTAVL
jgi:hypothetical protein